MGKVLSLTSDKEPICPYIRAYTVGSIARVGPSILCDCTGYGEPVIHELNVIGSSRVDSEGHIGIGGAGSGALESSISTSHDGASDGVGATALKVASSRIKFRNVCMHR